MLKLAGELLEGQLADHKIELDAHTRNIQELFRTGHYYTSGAYYQSVGTMFVNGKLYAVPFSVPRAITIDRIAIEVATAESGKSIRLGIYKNGTNLYPGELLLDAGTVSGASTGLKAITISQPLSKGLYWLVLVSDCTATLKLRTFYATDIILGHSLAHFWGACGGWSVAQAYGALPDPFTAGGAGTTGNNPVVGIRPSSLD